MMATAIVRSRWDDCDQNGHVNNAAYLALIRAAHDGAGMPRGRLAALDITYRQPVAAEVTIGVDIEVIEEAESHWRIAYALRVAGQPVADATALWQRASSPLRDEPPAIARDTGGRPFHFDQIVRRYDTGPDGSARPQAIVQWLEHAVFRAAARAGWPGARMRSGRFVTFVISHRLLLGEPVPAGAELVVTSRLAELRRVSGIWHHEIRGMEGALVAADRARGAFLDLEGRIRPAPSELLDDLLRGEPST